MLVTLQIPSVSYQKHGMFNSLKRRGFLTEKRIKHFTYEFKKVTNFGKL